MNLMAEDLAHHADELEGADVADTVIYPVGILAGGQNALVTQDRQMLRDVALRSPDVIDDVLDTHLPIAEGAEDLEAQWVRHGLERTRSPVYVSIIGE